ncbi:MAG: pyrroline-5-carboxylate reductase [Acidimicrobiales bacterium]
MTRLQLIGGGKMAAALLGGLLARGWAAVAELHVVETSAARRDLLGVTHPGLSVGEEPVTAADALIAVKPDVVPVVLPGLAGAGVTRVLSIAAGVRAETIEAGLPGGVAVVRCMPNTPALVGVGAAAIAGGAAATADDLDWAQGILEAVGTVVRVPEADLDAVTGLSGSGPAYVFLLAEALTRAGIAEGLPPHVADALTRQTLLGAATLLVESGADPASLRVDVTSPGGTTEAGLAVFADGDFTDLIGRVVAAATERSRVLGS